jgi:tetratricopeptide (TPR) repeat protein
MVARETEWEQMLSAIGSAMSGWGRLVFLAGEAGIGKTRLAQEVALAARGRGFLVTSGRCYEPAQAVAYYPFLEALSRGYAAAPPSVRDEVLRRWPEVMGLLLDQGAAVNATSEAAVASTPGQPIAQQRLFWAVAGFLEGLAELSPVALLLDDLHWADSASLALLAHLARRTRTTRVLLLGTYRDSEVERQHPLEAVLRDLRREQLLECITLRPLSAEGTAALVTAALGVGAIPVELAALLHRRAEGNPFFTHEVLRTLVDRGDIYRHNGGWERRAVSEILVPESVRSVVGERVARLSGPAQQALREASVLGQTFTFADLAGMDAGPEEDLETALEEATAAGLIRESGGETYTFHHVLIQQTLYEELSARRKQRLHRLAGEALEALPTRVRERRVAELAHHFTRGNETEKALTYLTQAAEGARLAGAYREEAALIRRALELAEPLEHVGLVVELRAKRGLAYHTLKQWKEADPDLTAAVAGLGAEQGELRAQVLIALAGVRSWLFDEASNTRRFATEALALAEQIGRDDLAASAIGALGIVDSFEGDLPQSLAHFERALARAGQTPLASVANELDWWGLILYWLGDYERAIARERQALELARQAHDAAGSGSMLETLGLALAGRGRYREGLQAIAEGESVFREHGAPQLVARGIAMRGGVHLEVYDFDGAQALAEEARELSRSVNWPNATVSAGIDLLLNFARRHEPSRAEGLVGELVEAAAGGQGYHRWLWQLRLCQARAEIALARDDWEEAVHRAEEAIAQSRLRGRVKYEVAGLVTRAQALAALGRKHEAIGSLQHAVALTRPIGDPALFLRAVTALLTLDGNDALLAEARGTAQRIAAELPADELAGRFRAAAPAHLLIRLAK